MYLCVHVCECAVCGVCVGVCVCGVVLCVCGVCVCVVDEIFSKVFFTLF